MAPASSGDNLRAELERIDRLVNDLMALLRTQRDILRQRGISLPPGTVSSLKSVHNEIEAMVREIAASEDELAQLRAVAETTALITSTLELDEVLNTVIDTVIKLTGAERGYIMLHDEKNNELTFRVARGMASQTLDRADFIVSKTIVEHVAESGEPVVTTNAQEDDRFSGQDSIVGFSLRSILCVPLQVRGKIIGVAYADNRIRAGLFGQKELDLLSAFANQAAVAIQNARLFESVRRSLDEITTLKELLDNVFSSIASGVITTDVEDIIITLNRAAQDMLASFEANAGLALCDVLPLDENFTDILRAVRAKCQHKTLEVEPYIPTRGHVNLNLRLSPLQDANNKTQGVAIVMDDLTEIRRQEAQLAAVRRYLPPQMVDNIQSIEALALGGVRRELTTLYVNVVPFELLFSSTDIEHFMALINRYLTIATDAIHEQEGVIDKYMGTDVMGLFNTQLNPASDHAWRAVRAALNVSRGLAKLQYELGESQLYCRAGIHTGVATVGNVGSLSRREFTAIGDSINLAHRLLENAHIGQIILSEDTYKMCEPELRRFEDIIKVTPHDPIRVKGRQQLTQIYEVRYR